MSESRIQKTLIILHELSRNHEDECYGIAETIDCYYTRRKAVCDKI